MLAAVIVVIVCLRTPDLRLERVGTCVATIRDIRGVVWRSNRTLEVFAMPAHPTSLDDAVWQVDVNSRTQVQTTLKEPVNLNEISFSASPDGRYLASYLLLDPLPRILVRRADGSLYASLPTQFAMSPWSMATCIYWMPDSSGFISSINPYSRMVAPARLRIWDSKQPGRLAGTATPPGFRNGIDTIAFLSPDDIRYTSRAIGASGGYERVTCFSARQPGMSHVLADFHVPGSMVGESDMGGFSPDGKRLAFVCLLGTSPPAWIARLERFHIPVSWHPQPRRSLCVCDASGAHFHEIAYIAIPLGSGPGNDLIRALVWSPDGKRLCCVHAGRVYVLDAR